MINKKQRSSPTKKALSNANDRRNRYGDNDKAARKLIPVRKPQDSRQDRRKVAQELSVLSRLPEEAAAVLESSARHDVHRVRGGWRKSADHTLRKVIAWALARKKRRAGRKAKSRNERS